MTKNPKIDRRRHYVLVLDTETANTIPQENGTLDMSNVLMYDCGWAVVDTRGNIYATASYVNQDIFIYEKELMQSAYYANKIKQYLEDIKNKKRVLTDTYTIRKKMLEHIKLYRIKEIVAHNAIFDYRALNLILRWTTKSKYRYWLPKGIEVWDTARMAKQVILKMPTYKKFCNKYNLLTPTGKLPCNAEALYAYITKNPEYKESHTALEDVLIEAEILHYCYRQKKKMIKRAWGS